MPQERPCLLITTIFILILRGSAEEEFDLALYRCSAFKKVVGVCKDCNSPCRLPVIRTKNDYEMMKRKMQEKKVSATWLGLRRVWLGEYLWLDCSKPFDDFLRQNWSVTDPNCVSLHIDKELNKAQLEPISCQKAKASLCQITGCRSCPALDKRNQCLKIDHTCYVVERNLYNWETARVVCQTIGGTLATITKEYTRNELKARLNPTRSNNYWVGLRREEWTYPNREFVPLQITTIHWDVGQPNNDGNCSIMINSSGGYVWRVVPCTAKYNALCIKPGQHINHFGALDDIPTTKKSNVTRLRETSETKEASSSYELTWTLLIGLVIFLLASLLAVSLYTCQRSAEKKKGLGTRYTPMKRR